MPRSNSNPKSISNSKLRNNNIKPIQTRNDYTPSYQPAPSFLSNVTQGFAWGTGSTIARNMFASNIDIDNNKKNDCLEYKLCKKLDNKEECFSKINITEYDLCKKLFE